MQQPRVASGWGDEPATMIDLSSLIPPTVPSTKKRSENPWDKESSSDIASIPTLSTQIESGGQVAAPPSAYIANTVRNLTDLDKLSIPQNPEPGIDLGLLTSVLKPPQAVFENDELWDYQHLIIEVSQAIREDNEEVDKDEEFQAQVMSMTTTTNVQ